MPVATPIPLEIRLFGPMSVRIHGEPMPALRSRTGHWLLALLILRHGRETSREWLAGTLWPDSSETQSAANLRRTLTDLRAALGTEAKRISSPNLHSLALDLQGAEVDVLRFDLAAKGGIAAWKEAVGQYQGALMEGCSEDWAFAERVGREQAYLDLLDRLADQFVVQGNPNEAVPYLRSAIAADPLREGSQRALMEALAQSGNYGAACLAYREFRLHLQKELATDPSPETVALYRRLRQETKEEMQSVSKREPSASKPHNSETPLPEPIRHLPNPISNFIGRENEIGAVMQALEQERLVTLVGVGGIGKTRLAIEVANRAAPQFREGVWFVDCASLSNPDLLAQTVATALDLRDSQEKTPLESLLERLRPQEMLIVLDNCEHLLEACSHLVEALLGNCSYLRVLATSRQALGALGEVSWLLAPLGLPLIGSPYDSEAWRTVEALRLFVERAMAANPAFHSTPQNLLSIDQICRRLDGIPLAIELAAARVKVLSPQQIASRLDDRFALLTTGNRSAVPRQQTLRALMDWSHELLNVKEKVLLRRLSVFSGGWTLEAVEGIASDVFLGVSPCNEAAIEPNDVFDLLSQLIEKSLVLAQERAGQMRYSFLETVREYAQSRLAETEEGERLHDRHQVWYTEFAEQTEPLLAAGDQKEMLERLQSEGANFRAALSWSVSGEGRLRLASALWRFWYMQGNYTEGLSWLQGALQRVQGASPKVHANALHAMGIFSWLRADYGRAKDLLERGLALRRELGDKRDIAQSLNNLGIVAYESHDFSLARRYHAECFVLYEEIDFKIGMIRLRNNSGLVAMEERDYEAAEKAFNAGIRLGEENNDRFVLGILHSNMGNLEIGRGNLDAAEQHFKQSFIDREALGDKVGVAHIHKELGGLARRRRQPAEARILLERALQMYLDLGVANHVTEAVYEFAALGAILERPEYAVRLFGWWDRVATEKRLFTPRLFENEIRQQIETLRADLGEALFTPLWEEGRSMSQEEAVSYALSEAK